MKCFLMSACIVLVAGCATAQPPTAADAFIASLKQLCGKSFPGRLVTTDPADKDMAGQKLTMGAVACTAEGVAIPFAMKKFGFDPAQSSSIIATTFTTEPTFSGISGFRTVIFNNADPSKTVNEVVVPP